MNKYMCTHTIGKNAMTRAQVEQVAESMQHDPNVRGQRSFINLTEGKIVCIVDATDERALSAWYQKNKIPVDSITKVELEGEQGTIRDAKSQFTSQGQYGQGRAAATA